MRILLWLGLTLVVGLLAAAGGGIYLLYAYGRDLPDYEQLADYQPPVTTRVHAGDGRLLVEFARERRVFVPIEAIPKRVVKAFIAAEDKNFYEHPGVDILSVIRAAFTNLARIGSDRRPVGASTITQQVAKNFLLSNEVSLRRKIKEAILAFRMEKSLGKDRILELYLNEIYLGFGSYGVAAAALNYFDKSLDELTLGEVAFLAGLPKAPNNYHPVKRPEAARARRDYVLRRMEEDGYATPEEVEAAMAGPVRIRPRSRTEVAQADYFVEEVRRELIERYGEKALYEGGLSVRTSLDPTLQRTADEALRRGLAVYDRRHGWRGPVARIDPAQPWRPQLARVPEMPGYDAWRLAAVLDVGEARATIGLSDGRRGHIAMAGLRWARPWREGQLLGPPVRRPADVLAPGDVVLVEPMPPDEDGNAPEEGAYALRQLPDVGGALVALDPHTGRVFAMSGGISYALSEFNRATQAQRQPGSAFKPFVYLAALEHGFAPNSLILDAPFVIDQGPGLGKWKPDNYAHRFYGPSPMRIGIEKSRNLMTVRLAQRVGMETVVAYAERFGVVDDMPPMLSMALGAGETTLLRLTAAYAMLDNGGLRITPSLIDRVQDRHGRTIFRHDKRRCPGCSGVAWSPKRDVPALGDDRVRIADPRSAYQVVSMLQGVVQRGTGVRVRSLHKPIAGKTGTTNDGYDAWFIGFSPDLAAGVYVGFDTPRTLGPREQGASVAVPIFRDFMAKALENTPGIPFRIPPGIRLVRVDAHTGEVVRHAGAGTILEAFKAEPEPGGRRDAVDDGAQADNETVPSDTVRGLY